MCLTKTWQSTSWLLQKKMDSTWTQSARSLIAKYHFSWEVPLGSKVLRKSWRVMSHDGPLPFGTGWVSMLRFMRTAGCAHFAWPLAAWIKDLRQPHAPSSYTQVEFIDFFPETYRFYADANRSSCFFLFLGCLMKELPVSDCQACSRKRTAARGLFRSW